MTVKHWISTNWGLKASVERYTNPYYQRDGLQLAVFRDLP
jgi:hypothetical protein